jgi:phosphoserine phosphatase RsbU/P
VCVPIATPTMLLGTLWIFSHQQRDFLPRETNVLEVVAGRLAAELEREMLMRSAVDSSQLQKQVAAAQRLQRNEQPTIVPMLDGWDLAGWASQSEGVGGAFYDWFCPPNGLLAIAAGRTDEHGLIGAMTAGAVRAAVRSHSCYHRQVDRILQQVNLTLWTSSAGDRRVSLFHALADLTAGRIRWASAGEPIVLRSTGGNWQSVGGRSTRLGKSPESSFEPSQCELQPGESLMILVGDTGDEAVLKKAMRGKQGLSAADLASVARSALDAGNRPAADRSLVVIRRKPRA